MNCPKCNVNISDDAVFCNKCGFKISGGSQVLSTNAISHIQEKSTKLYDRMTYSNLSKVLFFSVLIALLGNIIALFGLVEGAYVSAIPVILISIIMFYRAFATFVDINKLSHDSLELELRHTLSFFAYNLLLSFLSGMVSLICITISSWKYKKVMVAFNIISASSGGLIIFSIIVASLIFICLSNKIKVS